MAPDLVPFLMFEGQAGDALDLYVSALDDAEVVDIERREDRTIEAAFLRIGEQRIRLFDSPVEHGFGFTPAISFFVEFDEPEEVDAAFAKLSEDGGVLMPLDAYPFSPRFAWISDRFGVSWQLSAKPAP